MRAGSSRGTSKAVRSEHWISAISSSMTLRWGDDNPEIWEDWVWEKGGGDGGYGCVMLCSSLPCLEISH